jgi:hypothetical protein
MVLFLSAMCNEAQAILNKADIFFNIVKICECAFTSFCFTSFSEGYVTAMNNIAHYPQ